MLRFRLLSLPVCLALMALSGSASSEEKARTTRTVLQKYNDDLVKVWKDFPSDKQKIAREQHITDLNGFVTKDINAAEPPPNQTLQKVLTYYLEQVDEARLTFRLEKMLATRQAFIQACTNIFKREAAAATDYATARTTQQTYDLLVQWVEQSRDKLRLSTSDTQTQVYGALGQLFTEMLRTATIPEKTDHTAALDNNIKEARRKFPVSTEAMNKINAPIISLLETKAKEIQQKAVKQ
jgi:hypothetical protein